MRADICNADDTVKVYRFRDVLRELGAVPVQEVPVPGFGMMFVNVGGQQITIFMDEWSVDIVGPDELVRRVTEKVNQPAER